MPKGIYARTTQGFQKGNIPWIKGRKQSEEVKLKMSLLLKERYKSPEARKRATAHFIGNKWNIGRKQSEEHIKKVIEAKKGKYLGEKAPSWKGGEYKNWGGYILVLRHDHPYSDKRHYIMKHRLIMEEHLDRYLTKDEVVHHTNGIKDDNRIENLQLFESHSEHRKFEEQQQLCVPA